MCLSLVPGRPVARKAREYKIVVTGLIGVHCTMHPTMHECIPIKPVATIATAWIEMCLFCRWKLSYLFATIFIMFASKGANSHHHPSPKTLFPFLANLHLHPIYLLGIPSTAMSLLPSPYVYLQYVILNLN